MADNSFNDLRRLNALHHRAHRIVAKDYKRVISKSTLDQQSQARPTTWAKFITSFLLIKITTRHKSDRVCEFLMKNSLIE